MGHRKTIGRKGTSLTTKQINFDVATSTRMLSPCLFLGEEDGRGNAG